jgi:hypothetical protein
MRRRARENNAARLLGVLVLFYRYQFPSGHGDSICDLFTYSRKSADSQSTFNTYCKLATVVDSVRRTFLEYSGTHTRHGTAAAAGGNRDG